jgi:hypothetical protein
MGAVNAIFNVYVIAFLVVIVLGCWNSAYGRCRKCNNDRMPRCGCSPDNSRKPWKNHGK